MRFLLLLSLLCLLTLAFVSAQDGCQGACDEAEAECLDQCDAGTGPCIIACQQAAASCQANCGNAVRLTAITTDCTTQNTACTSQCTGIFGEQCYDDCAQEYQECENNNGGSGTPICFECKKIDAFVKKMHEKNMHAAKGYPGIPGGSSGGSGVPCTADPLGCAKKNARRHHKIHKN